MAECLRRQVTGEQTVIGKPTPRETNNFAPRIFTREGAAVSHPAPSRLGSGHCPPLCGSCCCGPGEGFFYALASFPLELAPLCGSCCWCRPGKGFSMLWLASSQSSRCLRQLLQLLETDSSFYGLRICFLGLLAPDPARETESLWTLQSLRAAILARSPFSPLSISCPDSHCLGAPNQNTRSQYYPR